MINYSIKYEQLGYQFRNIATENEQILILENLTMATKNHRNVREYRLYIFRLVLKKIKRVCPFRSLGDFKDCFENLFFTQIATSGFAICTSVYSLAFVGGRRHKHCFFFKFNQFE